MKNWNFYKMGFWASFASNKRPIPNSSSISKIGFTSIFDFGVFFKIRTNGMGTLCTSLKTETKQKVSSLDNISPHQGRAIFTFL